MNARPLGRTALRVSELALGTAPLGNLYAPVSDADAAATIEAAWAGGIRTYDTAPHYGLGLAERRLGRALAGRPRAAYVLCTKVGRLIEPNPQPHGELLSEGYAVGDALTRRRDYSADGVRRSLESSLERLGVDRVDLVHVHDPEDHMAQALRESVPALVELREQGVIGAVGVGMNLVAPLLEFVAHTDIDAVLVAGRYTLVDRTAQPLLDRCAERGVAVIAAAPFNSGLLAGETLPDEPRFDYGPAPTDVLSAARACAGVCTKFDVPLPAAALQFPLRHPAVACVLAGLRSAAEVHEALARLARPLPTALWGRMPPPART